MPAMDIGVLGRWLSSKDACTRGPARASGEAHTKVQIDGFRLVNSFWKLKQAPPWWQAFSTSHDDEFGTPRVAGIRRCGRSAMGGRQLPIDVLLRMELASV